MAWYYALDGQQKGPVDGAALDDLVRQGVVRDDTLVWKVGMDGWQPHSAVIGSKPASPGPPPPPTASVKLNALMSASPAPDPVTHTVSGPNTVRINELARELDVKPSFILELLPALGVTVKVTHSSSLNHEIATEIRRRVQVRTPLARRDSNKGSGVSEAETSAPFHAVSDDREAELVGRMRSLVQRVQCEIIDPARKTIAAAEDRVQKVRQAKEAAVKAAQNAVTQPRQEVERLLHVAREHLNGQNVYGAGAPPALMQSGVAATGPAPQQTLNEALSRIPDLKRLVEDAVLKTAKPKNTWRPDSDGGGCAMVIAGLVAGSILASALGSFFGFLAGFLGVYLPIMWWLHREPVSRLESLFHDVSEQAQQLTTWFEQYVRGVTANAEADVKSTEGWFQSTIATLNETLRPHVAGLQQDIQSLCADTKFAGAEWTSSLWQTWSPSSSPTFSARFGILKAETADLARHLPSLDLRFHIPALVPFRDSRCLLFEATGNDKDKAAQAVQSVITRLLATIPSAKARFTFIDPIGLGNNVAAFMPLSDYEESLVTGRAWSEPQHIDQRLGDLTEHIENVIQKYLRTDFKTIYDYNEAAKEVAEPYRFVVVFDFPVNFTDTATRRLVSIARNGARCGVYVLVVYDTSKPLPYGFSLPELAQSATVLRLGEQTLGLPPTTAATGTAASNAEEAVEFSVILTAVGADKINVIKAVREVTSLGLKEARDLVDGARKPVKEGVNKYEAELIRKKFVDAGATVEIVTRPATGGNAIRSAQAETASADSKVRREPCWRWIEADFQHWIVHLDSFAPRETLNGMIKTLGGLAKDAMRVEVPYEKLLSLAQLGEEKWWRGTTTKSIRVPLGPTGARKLQYLVLGEGMGHHALIVGRPGSGKSNLMHVIITTLALTYSPEEMRLYLIDFKKGVEFKSYAEHKLPHAEAIAVESEREFGLSVVERLDVELKTRGDLFRGAGASNITEYREKTGRTIPRVLLLVDEFQEFFTQDDHIARQTTLVLDRLVRQGRAFGIHIILGSQTLAGTYNLSRSTLDQMAVRIAMQCSEADSRLILSDDNPAARLLSRPGEAIYNAASGLVEGNNLFQVARFSEEDGEERLGLVGKIARDSGRPVPAPIVFEGNELAHLADCRRLGDLLSGDDWPAKRSVDLLLGEPIAIRDPTAARIRRQSGCHLLILSRDEAEGVGMCVASILSILCQQPPSTTQVFIADFTLADSEWAERAEEIEEFFPHQVKVLSRQRDVAEAVKTIADEVKRRSELPAEPSSIYFVLQGMHRIKVLRSDDESFSCQDDSSTPAEYFATIVRDGPEVGVHVISWCDTYSNAGRVVDRRLMSQFGLRAGGVMSADDSMNFFDDALASRIDKPHRVIFFDEDRPGQLEKFRPYSMPPREWIETAGRKLYARTKQ